ncbi:nuclear transport factor 2 family protein [Erythrobacter litoralis]|uniref:nuclear transport factor 2 family protein n=1 Tax=Erythrobacter litoralis TaxID=39960 RepID=UPI002435BEFE|nr:nuclear transport factor 2 family protein [Erythrobacter litoralis]MDG6078650.1 nuclear transport factor 2 family protein [Erythrobacter litoralis]
MVWSVFFGKKSKRWREASVNNLLSCLDAGDTEQASIYLAEDLVVADIGGARIEGRDAFLKRDQAFRKVYSDLEVHIDLTTHNGDEVLLRGRVESRHEEITGTAFWRFAFENGVVNYIETMRQGNKLTLPKFRDLPASVSRPARLKG